MIPHPTDGLKMLASRVLTTTLPTINSQFVASDTAMLAMLVTALADEIESGVSKRLNDIAEMKEILATAMTKGHSIPELPEVSLNDCTLSRVNAVHDQYTKTLVALHAEIEDNDEALNLAIWQYLAGTHQRHTLPL